MEIRTASVEYVAAYINFAKAAQAWLQSQDLKQYVPAAHDGYADAMRARAEAGTLYCVWDREDVVGFFNLDTTPSPWWPADSEPALYLAGMVVSQQARGRGIGEHIVKWCVTQASHRQRRFVRLDCHAGNPWLCNYYETHGFVLQGRVEQHPGYFGCLHELHVPPPAERSDVDRRRQT